MENEFLRKRLQQFEERLDSELTSRKELEQQVRQSVSPGCRSGQVLPARFEVRRGQGVPTVSWFPTSAVLTHAGRWGTWRTSSLPVVLRPGEEHPVLESAGANAGCPRPSSISASTWRKSLHISSLRFLISEVIVIFRSNSTLSPFPLPLICTPLSQLDQSSSLLAGLLASGLSPQPPATLRPRDLADCLSDCSVTVLRGLARWLFLCAFRTF